MNSTFCRSVPLPTWFYSQPWCVFCLISISTSMHPSIHASWKFRLRTDSPTCNYAHKDRSPRACDCDWAPGAYPVGGHGQRPHEPLHARGLRRRRRRIPPALGRLGLRGRGHGHLAPRLAMETGEKRTGGYGVGSLDFNFLVEIRPKVKPPKG